ncbi:MAG: alpha/beta fold hydrolase [Gammaproteobacteria bacterium]
MNALPNLSSTSARVAIPRWPWLLVLVWVAGLARVPALAQDANGIATGVAGRLPKGFTEKSAKVNGVRINYKVGGSGPVVVLLHGYAQTSHMWIPLMPFLATSHTVIAPDLPGFADSDKPYDGYEPKTIAEDMLALLAAERVEKFHILSYDLGGPPSVALAYMASGRALSLATIETPFFGLNFPGYVDPRMAYWHLGMHMNMDMTRLLIEGREEHTFGTSFAASPTTRRPFRRTRYSGTLCRCVSPGTSVRASTITATSRRWPSRQASSPGQAECADARLGGPCLLR